MMIQAVPLDFAELPKWVRRDWWDFVAFDGLPVPENPEP